MTKKDSEIRNPAGWVFPGDVVGHADDRARITKPGSPFGREEIGYVDREGKIREPDGLFQRGEVRGQVKDRRATEVDGIIFPGQEWGYVDEEGNVRLRDGMLFRGRIIGQMRGHNVAGTLGFYVLQFRKLEERCDALAKEAQSEPNKAHVRDRVRHMLGYVPEANALGDFDGLIRRLRDLDRELTTEVDERRRQKEQLCAQTEALSGSTDWKSTAATMRDLMAAWKTIGPLDRETDNALWTRFQAGRRIFFDRRTAFYEENRRRKEELCHRAEVLASSTEWKATGDALKALHVEWKTFGPAGKEADDALWQRFRGAQDAFFGRRAAAFAQREREQQANLRHKETLCREAEILPATGDLRAAKERVKALQAEWKTIGHVPREASDALWQRFRDACDRVFTLAREESERKHAEWERKTREALAYKRTKVAELGASIAHDEENIARWQDTLYNLRPGGREAEIRDSLEGKIADVSDRICGKRARVEELEAAIWDMETKLRG